MCRTRSAVRSPLRSTSKSREPRVTSTSTCSHSRIERAKSLPRCLAAVKWTATDVKQVEKDGQVRLFWDDNPVDLFFSTHAFHDRVATEIIDVPFADTTIPVLGATELAVFKAFFNRTKDWADIEAMLEAGTVDVHRALGWLVDLLGPDDDRLLRFRSLLGREPPDGDPRFAP